jgi:hypothetical protein
MIAPLPIASQIYRPILTLVGFLIIVINTKEPCLFLDNKVFKLANRIGLTIYVCFWPLLTLYKYCFGIRWYIQKQGNFIEPLWDYK